MRRVAGMLLVLMCACTDSAPGPESRTSTPSPERLLESSSVECPPWIDGDSGTGEFALWPDEGALEIVPAFDSICATPTSPHLFGLLYEEAGWSAGDLDAAALGILHRGSETVATFSALRVAQETPGIEEAEAQLEASGAALTEAGDLTVAWAGVGEHVNVFFVDDRDIVSLSAQGEADAADALTTWLDASGRRADVAVPGDIPELGTIPAALEAGAPVAGLPDGFSALGMDPVAFMGADFADDVTIHDEEGIDALGAAVIVGQDHGVLGTLVGASGASVPGLSEWSDGFVDQGVPAASLTAGDMSAFVVGDDQRRLDAFVDAWEKELKR